MSHRRLVGLIVGVGISLAIILPVTIVALSARPPGKLVADATLVNVAGMCPQGFARTINLHNDGGQAIHWQAQSPDETDGTDIHITPSAGTLPPHAQQAIQVQGHTLSGGFTVTFQWQGAPVNVPFSCNGPQ